MAGKCTILVINMALSLSLIHIYLPSEQFKASVSALRKDKPVLLYDNTRGQLVARAVLTLKKAGYKDLYVLKNGLEMCIRDRPKCMKPLELL